MSRGDDTTAGPVTESPSPGWGAALGFLRFGGETPRVRGPDALAIQQITERVYRYGWSFDERRADLLRTCFTENASWSGNIAGVDEVEAVHGRDTIVTWLSGFWDRQTDQRRHHMMSVSVTMKDDDHAHACSSLLLTSVSGSSLAIVLTSFYRFDLEQSHDAWRISNLFEGCDVPF